MSDSPLIDSKLPWNRKRTAEDEKRITKLFKMDYINECIEIVLLDVGDGEDWVELLGSLEDVDFQDFLGAFIGDSVATDEFKSVPPNLMARIVCRNCLYNVPSEKVELYKTIVQECLDVIRESPSVTVKKATRAFLILKHILESLD